MKSNCGRQTTVFGVFALCFCAVVYSAGEAASGKAGEKASEKASAQTGAAYPKGHYGALDKLPDWGGIWTLTCGAPGAKRETPTLKGKYLADYQAWKKDADAKHGAGKKVGDNCTPPGMPYIMGVAQ